MQLILLPPILRRLHRPVRGKPGGQGDHWRGVLRKESCAVWCTRYRFDIYLVLVSNGVIAAIGAFTPGCHKTHLPGYLEDSAKFREKGVDDIVCVTVNDAFVAGAWAESLNAAGKVRVLADSNAELTKALGLELDLTGPFGLGGLRTKRFSAVVVDGEIKVLNVEPDGGGLTCTLAPSLLSQV